jgi:hypothetical protein
MDTVDEGRDQNVFKLGLYVFTLPQITLPQEIKATGVCTRYGRQMHVNVRLSLSTEY